MIKTELQFKDGTTEFITSKIFHKFEYWEKKFKQEIKRIISNKI